jgi:hypothetical protein
VKRSAAKPPPSARQRQHKQKHILPIDSVNDSCKGLRPKMHDPLKVISVINPLPVKLFLSIYLFIGSLSTLGTTCFIQSAYEDTRV